MARNKLVDLNNILFERLETLNELEIDGKESEELLKLELNKVKGITSIAHEIITIADLSLQSVKINAEYCDENIKLPYQFNNE